MSAVLLPLTTEGVDWNAFDDHIARTVDAGLIPAVNMDTGYVHLIDDATKHKVLDRTPEPFVASALDHVDLTDDAYAIDLSIRLTPQVDVVLDRTPFTTWGGERVRGVPSRWCDLSGSVDGGEAGMLVVPHVETPWYGSTRAATYGEDGWSNFLNAAFLWDGPMSVAAGETVPFDFRVVVHDGVWSRERCEASS